jgi:isopenicillin N synthase-like dioxygenase
MLERWTNGIFKSTKHRVVMMATSDHRYSMPFFYEPHFDTVVTCLPTCCSDDHPAIYPPVVSGEYLLNKYRQTHADFTPVKNEGEEDEDRRR